jgi:hypothetical protein
MPNFPTLQVVGSKGKITYTQGVVELGILRHREELCVNRLFVVFRTAEGGGRRMFKSRLCLKSGEFVSLMVAWRIIAERSGNGLRRVQRSRADGRTCAASGRLVGLLAYLFLGEMVKGRRGDCGFLLLRGPGKRIGLALIFKTWGWRG